MLRRESPSSIGRGVSTGCGMGKGFAVACVAATLREVRGLFPRVRPVLLDHAATPQTSSDRELVLCRRGLVCALFLVSVFLVHHRQRLVGPANHLRHQTSVAGVRDDDCLPTSLAVAGTGDAAQALAGSCVPGDGLWGWNRDALSAGVGLLVAPADAGRSLASARIRFCSVEGESGGRSALAGPSVYGRRSAGEHHVRRPAAGACCRTARTRRQGACPQWVGYGLRVGTRAKSVPDGRRIVGHAVGPGRQGSGVSNPGRRAAAVMIPLLSPQVLPSGSCAMAPHIDRLPALTRIIHERFCCTRRSLVSTSLRPAASLFRSGRLTPSPAPASMARLIRRAADLTTRLGDFATNRHESCGRRAWGPVRGRRFGADSGPSCSRIQLRRPTLIYKSYQIVPHLDFPCFSS